MSMLSDMGITVVESEDREEGAAERTDEDGADNGDGGCRAVAIATPIPAIVQARAEPAERMDDPVRMYLRDMGSVELLSRQGEIAIAKRIEAGREAMMAGLCKSPLTFQAIIIWRDELMNAKILLREIIDLGATYEGPEAKAAPPPWSRPSTWRRHRRSPLSPPSVPRMAAKAALTASSTTRMSTRMRSRSPPWRPSSSRRSSRPSTTLPPRTRSCASWKIRRLRCRWLASSSIARNSVATTNCATRSSATSRAYRSTTPASRVWSSSSTRSTSVLSRTRAA
jgi:Sigma-70 factor, region 1.2